ncbi:MAG TPA: formate dehydrogenase accessory sulfurtransferase FdhD [Rhodanobacteraceae bacterium]|nr:formate dehydrogenase accessory sulfurtransferase FdhD [Rhodanobacteraceae bacterium]
MKSDSVATTSLPAGAVRREVLRHRAGISARVADAVAEEIPVAFVYNERPHAVMLATPADLEDFALGFSLSEAIIADVGEFEGVEVAPALAGIELRITVPESRAAALDQRVRQLTGRTGCGLCGAQTLDAAVRHPPPVADPFSIESAGLNRALGELQRGQTINSVTGATHAAAWATSDGRVTLVREDVGRHNALDKLIGAMQREHVNATQGFLVVTSRASYEMVMKSATVGVGIIAAISAPTALAIALAQEANVTLIGFARPDGYSVYTHAQRVHSKAQRNRSVTS